LKLFALRETARSLRALPGVIEVSSDDGTAATVLRTQQVDVVFSASAGMEDSKAAPLLTLERLAIDTGIPVVSEPALVRAAILAIVSSSADRLRARSWRHYLRAATSAPQRKSVLVGAGTAFAADPLRLFVRQPLTPTTASELVVIDEVFQLLRELSGPRQSIELVGGRRAESHTTFRDAFAQDTGQPFSGRSYPSPTEYPHFFYRFLSVAMPWQAAFLVIGWNPARFRLLGFGDSTFPTDDQA
jgi:hypothetical protein